jgi:tetratricopeptide (TPR) repeat protein
MKSLRNNECYLAVSVAVITFIVYLTALKHEFVEWDDRLYIIENEHIRSMGSSFFRWAFFDFYAGNWHPLTWISHAVDYAVWGGNPLGHHLTNIVIHAANTFAVMYLILKLLNISYESTIKLGSTQVIPRRKIFITAGIAGILFGLHPLHVESVAWVSERKDLLCAFFYLNSIIMYINYVRHGRYLNNETEQKYSLSRFIDKHYLFTFGLFILALLSKPMAVSLPIVLLILDWYPFNSIYSLKTFRSALFEKLPFLALCLISSILTIQAQSAERALSSLVSIPLSIRALVAAEALSAYLGKMVLPVHLVPFYPYPKSGSLLPFQYLSTIALVLGITTACAAVVKRHKLWLTVWGCYVVTLLPVLGIVQVGSQSMADRYMYLPSIGSFLVLGLGAAWLAERIKAFKKWGLLLNLFSATAAIIMFISLIYLTVEQIAVWKNSITLWNYVIKNYPDTIPLSYNNRGLAFEKMGQPERALEDYEKAIAINPSFDKAYINRGHVFFKIKGQHDRAIADFDRAIVLNPSAYEAYNNRGNAYYITGRYDGAMADYDRAIALNPSAFDAYNNRALVFYAKGQREKAIADLDRALALNPSDDMAYFRRGLIYEELLQPGKAIENYIKTITLKPSSHAAYYHLGVLYAEAGSFERAIVFANKAIALHPNNARYYSDRGSIYCQLGRYERALDDFNMAIASDQKYAAAYFNRGTIYLNAGKRKLARSDFRTACNLGMKEGCRKIGNKMAID